MMNQDIKFCRSPDGVRIAYATAGSGPPLIRAPIWMTHLDLDWHSPIWAHWFEALSQRHTLVRYDMRGSGLSDRLVDDLSVDAWVRDLETVVNDLGLERFPLLGICQGGAAAIKYAVRHPDRVSQLVLYGTYAQGGLVNEFGTFTSSEVEALHHMIKVGWGQDRAAFRQTFVNLLMPEASREQQDWLSELQRRSVSAETAARLWIIFNTIDLADEARQLQVPTLVLHARNDCMVPFEAGRSLAGHIPNARFVPLDSTNHILRADEPAWPRFLTELYSFLDPVPSIDEPNTVQPNFDELTGREREVLNLIAQGLSNEAIADYLVVAPKTVRNYVTRIYSKLAVESRAKAIVCAREAGYGVNGGGPGRADGDTDAVPAHAVDQV